MGIRQQLPMQYDGFSETDDALGWSAPPDGPKIVDDLVRECLRARRNSLAISIIMLMITESKKAIIRGRRSQIAALRSRALRGLRETDVVGKYDGERVLCILPGADIEGAIVAADRLRKLGTARNALTDVAIGYAQLGPSEKDVAQFIARALKISRSKTSHAA
jgi:PleD family two-component response regulator